MMKRREINSEKEWLGSRGIGGTLASAIIGVNPYKTQSDAYNELVFGNDKNISNEAIERGKKLEPAVRTLWNYLNPTFKVEEPPKENWLFYDDEHPYLTASFDGIITDENGKKGILEIKTRQGSLEEWENNSIPKHYYVQILHYLMISDYDYAIITCFALDYNGTNFELITRRIERENHIEEIKKLKKVEMDFYKKSLAKVRPKEKIDFPLVKSL